MGRPAKFDRDAAVEIAMQEIWRHGFEACSVATLSARLGITRSSFYNAFCSREALFLEALERYLATTPDRMLATIPSDAAVLPLLTEMFRALCHDRAVDPEARGCMAVNAVAELTGTHETLGPILESRFQESIARIECLLARAVKQGELPPETDVKAKALALKSLIVGLNLMGKVVPDEATLWAAARHSLEGLGLWAEAETTHA